MTDILLLLLGLGGLWGGTELTVQKAVALAKRFGLSQTFIGLGILAVGTDLSELVVATTASIDKLSSGRDTSGIIIGNPVGSAIAQISLVLGVYGLFRSFRPRKHTIVENGTALIGSVVLLFLFALDGVVVRWEGIVLLLVYGVYYVRLFSRRTASGGSTAEGGNGENTDTERDTGQHNDSSNGGNGQSTLMVVLLLIVGMAIVVGASELTVDRAVLLAERWGMSRSAIAVILLGAGTSLPELAVAVRAAIAGAGGISVGNIIGSNIFDQLIPVGVGTAIAEARADKAILWTDLPLLFALSCVVVFFLARRRGLQRIEGIILIVLYIAFVTAKLTGVLPTDSAPS